MDGLRRGLGGGGGGWLRGGGRIVEIADFVDDGADGGGFIFFIRESDGDDRDGTGTGAHDFVGGAVVFGGVDGGAGGAGAVGILGEFGFARGEEGAESDGESDEGDVFEEGHEGCPCGLVNGTGLFGAEEAGDFHAVFVAASGEIDDEDLFLGHGFGEIEGVGDGVGGFEGGDDAFALGGDLQSGEGLLIRDGIVLNAAGVFPIGVFGADAGVIETGGDGVNVSSLAVGVLEDVAEGAVKDARVAHGEGGGVLAETASASAGFRAVEFDSGVFDEGVEDAGGVGTATDARDDGVREAAEVVEGLLAGFDADDGLKVADDGGEGMGAGDGADDVVGIFDGAHPIAHGFVEGVFEGFLTGLNGDDFGTHEFHAEDVEGLTADVFGTHVDVAGEAEDGGGGGGADAVLAGTGFSDDAFFFHAEGEERLADGVVDFVGAGVAEVFAFQVDFGAGVGSGGFADELGEAFSIIEGRGAADELFEVIVELLFEGGVFFGALVFFIELMDGDHERFGDVGAAVGAEVSEGIGDGFGGGREVGVRGDVRGGEARCGG